MGGKKDYGHSGPWNLLKNKTSLSPGTSQGRDKVIEKRLVILYVLLIVLFSKEVEKKVAALDDLPYLRHWSIFKMVQNVIVKA